MVDFHNTVTFAREFAAMVNLWHTVNGIFIWEFFTTLNYEWDVVRGHRPYRRTIWVYSITRVAALMAIVLNMLGFDNAAKVNCQALFSINNFFSYLAFGSASLLIVLRIIAIWNTKAVIVLIAMGVWLADVGFLIYGTAELRGVWSDESGSCVIINMQKNKINIIVALASDVVLLLVMIAGLLRLRHEIGEFGLGRILWNQSLVWLLLATVAEVPPTVFMCLNLNDALDFMFWNPAMAILTIGATRMYRSLVNLSTTEVSSEAPVGPLHKVSRLRFHSQPVPLKQVPAQVSLGTDSDEHRTSQSKVAGQTPLQTLTV